VYTYIQFLQQSFKCNVGILSTLHLPIPLDLYLSRAFVSKNCFLPVVNILFGCRWYCILFSFEIIHPWCFSFQILNSCLHFSTIPLTTIKTKYMLWLLSCTNYCFISMWGSSTDKKETMAIGGVWPRYDKQKKGKDTSFSRYWREPRKTWPKQKVASFMLREHLINLTKAIIDK